MGCVNNVYQHQQYLISCFESLLCELRKYPLKKNERDLLGRYMNEFYIICLHYRNLYAALQRQKIQKVVSEMSTPRVYDCEDDLPF